MVLCYQPRCAPLIPTGWNPQISLIVSAGDKSPMRSLSAWKPQSIIPGESPPTRKYPKTGVMSGLATNRPEFRGVPHSRSMSVRSAAGS